MLRRLDRYLISEMIGPLGLGFLVYTSILLIRFLFQSAEMIIKRGLPISVVGELLAYTLPNIVVLTIPMSLLFGILIGLGRLASDSELIAIRASGISLLALYRPIILVSGLLTVINILASIYILPRGNHQLQQLRLRIITETVAQQIEPRIFYPEFEGFLLYVFDIPEDDPVWHGVFLAQAVPTSQKNNITVAERGRLRLDETGEKVVLELENAYVHEVDLGEPDRYEVTLNRRAERVLEDEFVSTQKAKISSSKTLRELNLAELRDKARDPLAKAEDRNLAQVEIHKKFAIPSACLVFGLFALPLGFNNRRGSKVSGFALSMGVFLLYYVLLNNGEEAARFGKLPPALAMWLPNLLLAGGGLILFARRNRDKSLMLSKIDRWIRQDLWSGLLALDRLRKSKQAQRKERRIRKLSTPRATNGSASLRLRLPRWRLRVPNLLDRYVFRAFVGILVLVSLSGLLLYVVGDLSENVDDILKNNIPKSVVLSYYQYLSLNIFYEIAPILVLVTTLITFSLLSRTNEVTACRALGISLFRISVPAIMASILVALLCFFLEAEVLPASNQRVQQLKDQIKARETARTYRRADRQWLFGQGRYVYNYLNYDDRAESLQRLQIFEFDDGHRLVSRLFANQARYSENDEWLFEDGWVRDLSGPDVASYQRFPGSLIVDYPETPDYFDSEIRPPDQMGYNELREYIDELADSGQRTEALEVQLHQKLAYPTISLVMALVGLPFAFRLGKQGALYGIGVSIILGIIFIGVFAFFSTLGETGALPASVAVWSPNLLFAMLAGYLFLGVRT
ncbi:MAG: LPS export ABC transporter permease LptG [Acidobacteriota bacterium]